MPATGQEAVTQLQNITAAFNASNIVSHVPATGQEAVTQLQNITGPDGALPTLGPYNGFIQTDKENISDNDESDWLHTNDVYQMQRSSRRMTLTQLAGVDNPQHNTVVNLRTPGVTFHDQG